MKLGLGDGAERRDNDNGGEYSKNDGGYFGGYFSKVSTLMK